jgi:hypothetical protein
MATVSHEIDYTKKSLATGQYKYSNLYPLNGVRGFGLNVAGTVQSVFEIPTKVINFSKCFLRGSIFVGPQMAETDMLAYNIHKYGHVMIDSISLTTRSGLHLMDTRHHGRWSRASLQAYTSKEKYLSKPLCSTNLTVATAGVGEMFSPAYSNYDFGSNTNTSHYPNSDDGEVVLSKNSLAVDLITKGVVGETAANGALAQAGPPVIPFVRARVDIHGGTVAYNFNIPFSDFKDTILATNKDLFFNEVLVLTINWNNKTRLGFTNTGANVDAINDIHSGLAPLGNNTAISNIGINLAVETDQQIVNELKSKILSSGLSMFVPYVHCYRMPTPAGATSTIQQKINKGHGRNLLRIITTTASPVEESSPLDWNCGNVSAFRTQQFHTQLNSMNQQENNLMPATFDDFVYLSDLLKGSSYVSSESFYANAIWIDNFHGDKSHKWSDTENDQDWNLGGLDLTEEKTWNYVADEREDAIEYVFYVFVITQKFLTISKQGIDFN